MKILPGNRTRIVDQDHICLIMEKGCFCLLRLAGNQAQRGFRKITPEESNQIHALSAFPAFSTGRESHTFCFF